MRAVSYSLMDGSGLRDFTAFTPWQKSIFRSVKAFQRKSIRDDDELTSEIRIEKFTHDCRQKRQPNLSISCKTQRDCFFWIKREPFVLLNEHYVHPTALKMARVAAGSFWPTNYLSQIVIWIF